MVAEGHISLNKFAALRCKQKFMKQKIAKLKFVNWTSKNEKIVEIFRMSRFLLHLMDFFYFGIKSNKIEHRTFKTRD